MREVAMREVAILQIKLCLNTAERLRNLENEFDNRKLNLGLHQVPQTHTENTLARRYNQRRIVEINKH